MLRLRKFNRLCSSTLSDPANRLLKRTDSEGSSSVAEKKSSAVPPISKQSPLSDFRRAIKQGKGRSSKRKENRRLSFLFAHRRGYGAVPAAGAATLPPSADGESPAEVQRKTLRPSGANPPAAVRVPRWVGAEKECRPDRANTLTQFAHPAQPVLKKLPPHSSEPPARFVCPA